MHPLPSIPVLDIPEGREAAVASVAAEPDRLALLLGTARRTYTPLGVTVADALSRSWSARSTSPYAQEVIRVHAAIGRRGAFLLNYSYEWGCTSGAADDPMAGGVTLSRTLDWPFDNLGRALIVVRQQTAMGPYLSVTWPGFSGVLTCVAPGRFAAAINQPPLPLPGWGKAIGWLAARARVRHSTAPPPSHALRLACETCRTFEEAVALLRGTPLCMPAIFTLAGPETGQAVVIERTETATFQPASPVAANHWASDPGPAGKPRHASSLPRHAAMAAAVAAGPDWSLDWLRPPILQPDTRLAMMANPRTGRLVAQGLEASGAVTAVLDIV